MTWTYSGDPGTSDLDAVRFLIGDTDQNDPQLQNAEIAYLLSRYGSPDEAAAAAAESLASYYSRRVDKAIGAMRISESQKMNQYLALAKRLRQQGILAAIPFAGGISQAQKDTTEADSDRVVPFFSRDTHRHPGAGG